MSSAPEIRSQKHHFIGESKGMDYQAFVKKLLLVTVGASAINLVTLTAAEAAAIISVDTDPLTPGIQSSLTVAPTTPFTVGVVIFDDGTPLSPVTFDTVILETFFNDAGAVLGLGPTGPIAGAIAGAFPTFDVFSGFVSTGPGTPLGIGPSSPAPPFASGSGAIGLSNPLFAIAPGPATSIFSLDFIALTPGSSTILAAGSPPGSPELALASIPIPATLAPATITVTSPTTTAVPEPITVVGSALALGFGMVFGKRRKQLKA